MSDCYTGFVAIRGAQFVLADDPSRAVKLKGSNFQTVSTPWRLFERWDEPAVARTLDLCSAMGCNCLRAFIELGHSERLRLWDRFKQMAADRGMRMYVSFHWPNRFAAADTAGFKTDRDALVEVLRRQLDDPRIIAYDIINEPEWISHQKYHWRFDEPEGQRRLEWLLRINDIFHEFDHRHPVTIGFIFCYTWWTPDWARVLLDRMDFVDFHYYHRTHDGRGLDTAIAQVKAETGKPIVVGEFGQSSDPTYFKPPHESTHSEQTQAKLYAHAMKAVVESDIVGCLQWSTCAHDDEPRADGENEYGIHRQDESPKPAARVFAEAMKVSLFK